MSRTGHLCVPASLFLLLAGSGCGGDDRRDVCGDGTCASSETRDTCPMDCHVCGDGVCALGIENVINCRSDCVTEYPQSVVDEDVVWTVIATIGDIFNQNIAGRPSGAQDVNANCPLSGSAHIVGTVTVSTDTGITATGLTYDLTDCGNTKTCADDKCTINLTLTGSLTEAGSWNNTTGFLSRSMQSDSLTMSGTASRDIFLDATIDQTCAFSGSVTRDAGSTSGSTVGQICDRSTSWTWD
ncbi:hypothetical protein ACFL6C_10330 [Myxococcota bacterium]